MTVRHGAWTAQWSGGRLADVFHDSDPESAVECIQIGEYDFSLNSADLAEQRAGLGRSDVLAALREWVDEQGECYIENVVAYR